MPDIDRRADEAIRGALAARKAHFADPRAEILTRRIREDSIEHRADPGTTSAPGLAELGHDPREARRRNEQTSPDYRHIQKTLRRRRGLVDEGDRDGEQQTGDGGSSEHHDDPPAARQAEQMADQISDPAEWDRMVRGEANA